MIFEHIDVTQFTPTELTLTVIGWTAFIVLSIEAGVIFVQRSAKANTTADPKIARQYNLFIALFFFAFGCERAYHMFGELVFFVDEQALPFVIGEYLITILLVFSEGAVVFFFERRLVGQWGTGPTKGVIGSIIIMLAALIPIYPFFFTLGASMAGFYLVMIFFLLAKRGAGTFIFRYATAIAAAVILLLLGIAAAGMGYYIEIDMIFTVLPLNQGMFFIYLGQGMLVIAVICFRYGFKFFGS